MFEFILWVKTNFHTNLGESDDTILYLKEKESERDCDDYLEMFQYLYRGQEPHICTHAHTYNRERQNNKKERKIKCGED